MLIFANAAAALVTERKGALKVIPDVKEITDIMEKTNRIYITITVCRMLQYGGLLWLYTFSC